jgi:pimeloyl-ACP methyl ester carboxylesterase
MDERGVPAAPLAVATRDGLRLAAWTRGGAGPPVVFMHGYPDTSAVWDAVVQRLSGEHRCIAYDVRGAGESAPPASSDGYGIALLLEDLVAVIEATAPGEPVHLVGHDWGSVVAWEAACRSETDPRLAGRIASLTSISGPCFGHVGAFYRAARRAPWRSPDGRALKRAAAAQAVRSWYIYAFHVPRVSDAIVRARSSHVTSGRSRPGRHFGPTLPKDAVNGLNLYRANVRHYEPIPGGPRTDVPTLLIVPTRDKYVTPAMTSQVARYVPNLARVEIDAGHWPMRSRPAELADLIKAHIARSAPQDPSRA